MITLAKKYGLTPYILLACSLRNTGLSYWNTNRVLNRFIINMLVDRKKNAPNISIAA